MSKVTYLLFDDDQDVLNSLSALLKPSGLPIHSYRSGAQFQPDRELATRSVSIIDLNMPGGDGFSVIQKLQDQDPGAVFMVHTATATVGSATQLMMKRAATILEKPSEPEEFLKWSSKCLEQAQTRIGLVELTDRVNEMLQVLSRKEQMIALRCAVYHENKEIAERSCLSIRTVEGHRMSIANKLGKTTAKTLYRELAEHLINRHAYRLPPLCTDELN